jgi:hypothetical protein
MVNVKEYNLAIIDLLLEAKFKLDADIDNIAFQLNDSNRCANSPAWADSARTARSFKKRKRYAVVGEVQKRQSFIRQIGSNFKCRQSQEVMRLNGEINSLRRELHNNRAGAIEYRREVRVEYEKISARGKLFIDEIRLHLRNEMGKEAASRLFSEIGAKVNSNKLEDIV